MRFSYEPAAETVADAVHHAVAATENVSVVEEAIDVLKDAVIRESGVETVLLKAAAGAGKSYALRRMIREMLETGQVNRIGVAAFQNNQIEALVRDLSKEIGKDRVGWLVGEKKDASFDDQTRDELTIRRKAADLDESVQVVAATSHKFGAFGESRRLLDAFNRTERPFDVLFVDEAWQLAQHLFSPIAGLAPVVVGVGDVGQLPPLEIGSNPWRGDARYNPYRAWPHAREHRDTTWSRELPTVWRPSAPQLSVWRAFYPEWESLNCVAGPGDRSLQFDSRTSGLNELLALMSRGFPVMLEVDGLPPAEAADVDLPLTRFAEHVAAELVERNVQLLSVPYGDDGTPSGGPTARGVHDGGDPVLAILATRNQTVDDAAEAVDRVSARFGVPSGAVVASTVDSWQGQTNGITIAIHPLSGAEELDEFNSAFGRLAVTCTRATHSLLVLAREGLDDLLTSVAARPGTPFGEPGSRLLPRQTHQRILRAFARAKLTLEPGDIDLDENP